MRFVVRRLVMGRYTHDLDMILREHSVVEHSEERTLEHFAVAVEHRRFEDDVVGLPLTRLAAGVYEWGVLLVNGRRLAVKVCLVLKRIENLHLVRAHEKDAA